MTWTKKKPDLKEESLLITATKFKDDWDYNSWRILRVDDGDEWYLGLCDIDGYEWDDYEELTADLYLIIPLAE